MLDNWNDSFAKTQLEKYGWKKGDGLGKNKHGNTKHITVKVKNDTKGIGGNQQQWDFAWWDHLYNKSASSVTVEKDESKEIKVAVKKKSAERRSKTGIISTHRPTGTTTTTTSSMASIAEEQNLMDSVKSVHSSMAQTIARTSLYSGFVKSSSVLVGTDTQKDSDKENDEEDDEQKDYSIKMTDEELFAACEGRTARKGGRGLVEQKGKYARVMQDYIHKRDATDDEEQDNDKKRKREDKDEKASSSSKKKAKKDKKDKDEKALTSSKKKDKKEKKKNKKDKKEKKKKAKKEKK